MKTISAFAFAAAAMLASQTYAQADEYIRDPQYRLTSSNPSVRVTLTDAKARNVDLGTGDVLTIQGRSTVLNPGENMATIDRLAAAGVVKLTMVNETRAQQALWDRASGESNSRDFAQDKGAGK